MEITQIEAIPFSIPYAKPLQFASGEVHVAEHVLVRVHTCDGVVGVAEAPARPFTYGETQAGIVAVIDSIFAPQLVGCSLIEREKIAARLHRTVGNPTAKAALDMAIWDALGHTVGFSVSQMLGGFTDRMRVSHMLGFGTPSDVVAEAERCVGEYGIRTFKVKVGRQPYQVDTDAVHALRRHFGDDIDLYIDGNRGWTANQSAAALRELRELNVMYAEELCPADDVLARRWLVSRSEIPFVADESATTPAEVVRELLAGSATALSVKTARSGFSVGQRIIALGEAFGVDMIIGNQIDGQLGTVCSVVFGAAHRSTSRQAGELSNFLDMSDDLLQEPLVIRDGELVVPTGFGLGVAIDEDKLNHYRQDG